MNSIQQFMASIDAPNTAKVVKHVLEDVDINLQDCSKYELEKFILSLNPNSHKAITTICYVLGLYFRWLYDQGIADGEVLYSIVQSLDKNELWKKAKPTARKKFISFVQYARIICDIGLLEEFNELYYQTLFSCVYEGIYNDDMSVLKNLRASDVHGNLVTLHEDNGHTYTFKISNELANNIVKLSEKNIWERKNRNGICRVHLRGLYADSVFKIEERKRSTPPVQDSYKFTFYSKLRKISEEYMDYRILPFPIYISGIMHRIIIRLNQKGLSVSEAFSDNCRNKIAHEIISAELIRSNYTSDISNFREIVKGHLECF